MAFYIKAIVSKYFQDFFYVKVVNIAAGPCIPVPYILGGVRFGFWLMGKLGRAWVGAWHDAWMCGSWYIFPFHT